MNRRNFVLAASAGMALIGSRAVAQRRSGGSSSVLTSELTGGEIDPTGSSLELINQHLEETDGSEHFHFYVDEGSQFDIIIWPQASGDAGEFTQSLADMSSALLSDADSLGSEEYDDGGWLAMDFGNVAYYEYQLGAYPGHDLVVAFNTAPEEFADTFEQAQAVLIDGLPPFLFTQESDILALASARVSTPTSSLRTGRNTTTREETTPRNTRGSRSSSSQTSTATEESSGSRTSSRTSMGNDPIEIVRNHRDAFLDSYDEFFALLESAADETAPSQTVEQAFTDMVDLARGWQQYPTDAAKVQFGPEHTDLKAVYLEWADIVGELGLTFEDFSMNLATVDDFLNVYDEFTIVDTELRALLRNAGHTFTRTAKAHKYVASRLFGANLVS